ncbi:MAG TPA: aspartate-semialdehyde dehydrogenase [Candidatus Dormibacteraeota bacterium]
MSGRDEGLRVAVVGATGAAGGTLLRILEERGFPVAILTPLASARSAGIEVTFRGASLRVAEATPEALKGVDMCFLAAGAGTARELAPEVAAAGGVAIDKSSAYRADPAVPLVVPEVNPDALQGHRGIVANPNCVATPLSVTLAPLQRAHGLRHVTVATYQAASGAGRALLAELIEQERASAAGEEPGASVYPHVLHGNVVPGGWAMEGDDTDEERKVVAETRRVLGRLDLALSVTTVRVPVPVAHSAAVWVELEEPVSPERARELFARAPGIRVVDDAANQRYPTPRQAAGGDEVLVGRVRSDLGQAGALAFFWSCDNLRKGAALNAVQVAELLTERARVLS